MDQDLSLRLGLDHLSCLRCRIGGHGIDGIRRRRHTPVLGEGPAPSSPSPLVTRCLKEQAAHPAPSSKRAGMLPSLGLCPLTPLVESEFRSGSPFPLNLWAWVRISLTPLNSIHAKFCPLGLSDQKYINFMDKIPSTRSTQRRGSSSFWLEGLPFPAPPPFLPDMANDQENDAEGQARIDPRDVYEELCCDWPLVSSREAAALIASLPPATVSFHSPLRANPPLFVFDHLPVPHLL